MATKYFEKEPKMVDKQEVLKFMRFYSQEIPDREPFPNSVEDIMHRVKSLGNSNKLSFE